MGILRGHLQEAKEEVKKHELKIGHSSGGEEESLAALRRVEKLDANYKNFRKKFAGAGIALGGFDMAPLSRNYFESRRKEEGGYKYKGYDILNQEWGASWVKLKASTTKKQMKRGFKWLKQKRKGEEFSPKSSESE